MFPSEWFDYIRLTLYVTWGVMILLIVKLLIVRSRWRHPFRGSGPMLWALLLILASVEWSRARNIAAGEATPPPYLPSLVLTIIATLLIMVWLWQQMELIPRWIRQHLHRRRKRESTAARSYGNHTYGQHPADYTKEEDTAHGPKPR